MRRSIHHRLTSQALRVGLICVLASAFIITAHAGLRAPGKYCGVVVFDRWDTCFLLSGHFITYVSGSVKDELRPYAGKATQIDASEVSQPQNPGDALVRKYRIIGPAPDNHRGVMLDGLELTSQTDFAPQGTASFLIELRNSGDRAITVNSSEFGPTLLGLSPQDAFSASDGKSGAWLTRRGLLDSTHWESSPTPNSYYVNWGVKHSASYTIDPKTRPPERFQLAPGQSVKVRVTFRVPPGEYQFIVGYGGGVHEEKSLASNAISFDVNASGIATLAKPEISNAR